MACGGGSNTPTIPVASNPNLTGLILSNGSLSPSFTPATVTYTASVSNNVSSITVTPTSLEPNASILVNQIQVTSGNASNDISLEIGSNVIAIEVTGTDGKTKKNYTLTVTRQETASNNAKLSGLNLSTGSLTPIFAAENFDYTATVSFKNATVSVVATSENSNADIRINGAIVVSGTQSDTIDLSLGDNLIQVDVLAQDGITSNTYRINMVRNAATSFMQTTYIKKPSNVSASDLFGSAVELDGNTLAVPAINDNGGRGSVYIYTYDGINWLLESTIRASNPDINDQFGSAISLDGNTIAIGSLGESSNSTGVNGNQNDNSLTNSGAVYVFTRNGTSWTQQAYIKASNTGVGDAFGAAIELQDNTLVIGALNEDSDSRGINGDQSNELSVNSGAAYVFTRSGTNWSQQTYIKASNADSNDQFGGQISLDGNSFVIGVALERSSARGINGDENDNSAKYSGAVYVFTYDGSNWAQQAYIKSSNSDASDFFGISVSLNQDTLAVGARQESSNAIGVDGDQMDNSSSQSGAVYVFARTGGIWSQQSYLKSSNSDGNDHFGFAISLSGSQLVVASREEDSGSTGVDGDLNDNSIVDSGAAYLFENNAGVWSQKYYIKASNTDSLDGFSHSIVLENGRLVVGAIYESSSATGINGNQGDNSISAAGAIYIFEAE